MKPISTDWGFDRGLPVDRFYIEKFISENSSAIGGHVVEIADRAYTVKFGGDRVIRVRCPALQARKSGSHNRRGSDKCPRHSVHCFDCMILTQTLNFIFDVRAALATIHRIMKPGGIVLMTSGQDRQISQHDLENWGDFWRFTSHSLKRLCLEAGHWHEVDVRTWGNVLSSAAFLYGVAAEELRLKDLEHYDPQYQLIVPPGCGNNGDTSVVGSVRKLEVAGCRLAYRISGTGPPLVMIQGVGAYGAGWNPQVEILEKYYTCLTFDNRQGIGASQPPADHLTVDRMAADTIALMDHAGWASAHIVGHSLGGLIALQVALDAKARVRSLALLCTFARGADAKRITLALLWTGLRMRFGPRRVRRRAFLDLVLPPGRNHDADERIAQRLSKVFGHDVADTPPITNQQLDAMTRHDVTPRLGELAGIPTLVISGENDTIAPPSSGRAIAVGIPGARYVEIAGGSHAFPVLQAERCGAMLLEHLNAAEKSSVRTV